MQHASQLGIISTHAIKLPHSSDRNVSLEAARFFGGIRDRNKRASLGSLGSFLPNNWIAEEATPGRFGQSWRVQADANDDGISIDPEQNLLAGKDGTQEPASWNEGDFNGDGLCGRSLQGRGVAEASCHHLAILWRCFVGGWNPPLPAVVHESIFLGF